MAVELATAYVSLVASASGIQRSIAQELGPTAAKEGAKAGTAASQSFATRFRGGLKELATTLGPGLGIAAGVVAINGLKNAASDLAETVSKSNTVFGDNAQRIERWASSADTAIGQSKEQALDAASTFGNLFTQLGIGSGTAADMSVQMVELASDFASFHNADITDVLTAQQAAFRGEYDALQRFVPIINAAAVEQKALEQTGKASTKELTAQEKALATQALMMENAGAAAGDFARTSDGLANRERILSARFQNLQARIGQALIPVFNAAVGLLLDVVIPGFETAGDVIRQMVRPIQFVADNWDQFKFVVAAAAAVMIPHFVALGTAATVSAAKNVAGWVLTQGAAVRAAATHSAQIALQVARWVFLGAQSLLHAAKVAAAWLIAMGPIAIVGAAVVALVVLVVKNWDRIKEAITTAATFVLDFLRRNWPLILAIITGPIGLIVLAVVRNWDDIKRIISNAWSSVRDTTVDIWNKIVGGVSSAIGEIVDFARGLPQRVIDAITGAGSKLLDVGKEMVKKIVEGIKAVAGDIGNAILGAIPGGNAIGKAIGKINPFDDGIGVTSGGGSFGAGRVRVTGRTVAGGTWQRLLGMVGLTGLSGVTASSVYRPGAVTLSGNRSYHASGRAVDLVAPSLARLQIALQRFAPVLRELIGPIPSLNWHNGRPHRYSSAVQRQHGDHVHMALHRGGMVTPRSPGWVPGLARDERFVVLQTGERVIPRSGEQGRTLQINGDIVIANTVEELAHELHMVELLYGGA